MKNKMYICIGKLVGIEPTDTYFKRYRALSCYRNLFRASLPKH